MKNIRKSIVAIGVAALSAFSAVGFADPMYRVDFTACAVDGKSEKMPTLLMQKDDALMVRCNYAGTDAVVVCMPVMDGKFEALSLHVVTPSGETLVDDVAVPIGSKAMVAVDKCFTLSVGTCQVAE